MLWLFLIPLKYQYIFYNIVIWCILIVKENFCFELV